MADIFKLIFGDDKRPVRRDLSFHLTADEDGEPVIETLGGESYSLSRDGSIDHTTVTQDRFYHCGHNAERPMGGRCGEPNCRRVSCSECFCRCGEGFQGGCLKPLCVEHVRRVETPDGRVVGVCFDCHTALKRRRMLDAIGRGLLTPFVVFKKSKTEKGA